MARGVNKVFLVGNLGEAPELNHTQSGTAVTDLRVATDESYTDSGGERVERTDWHDVVAWDRLAETCVEHLSKGSPIHVEGSLQTRQWEDQDGNTCYTTEIKARSIQFLGRARPQQNGQRSGGRRNSQREPARR